MDVHALPTTQVDTPTYRIIAARYPAIDLFERVASAAQWDVLYEIEALTNTRLRDEVGDIHLVPAGDRVYGPGASWIMAAFTHAPRAGQGGRFNSNFGTYYTADSQATAVAETSYHRARFLRQSKIEESSFVMRLLRAHVGPTDLQDIRRLGVRHAVYNKRDYAAGQALGDELKQGQSAGIFYRSVRCKGECMAIFRPLVLSNAVHRKYLQYTYSDGTITNVRQINE